MKFILTAVLTLAFFATYAQWSGGIEFKPGYASYNMTQLSGTMHHYRRSSFPGMKLTDDYPAYISLGAGIYINFGHWQVGGDFSRYTTGARKHYKDYSGEVGYDQRAKAKAFGGFCRYRFDGHKRIRFELSVSIAHYSSMVNFNEYLRTDATREEKKLEVVSKSFIFTPMAGTTYELTDYIYTGIRMGYAMDTNGKLHLEGMSDSEVIDYNGDPVYTDWSGFRSELFVGFRLGDLSGRR